MTTDLSPGVGVPLLESQHPEVPRRAAWVPRHLDRYDVQALVADAYPELQQEHRVNEVHELVHLYRDRESGSWVVCVEHAGLEHRGTIQESGRRPVWDRLVVLVDMWEQAGRPVDVRSLLTRIDRSWQRNPARVVEF